MSHRLVGLCAALLVGGVLVAACGGGGSSNATNTTTSTTTTSSTHSSVSSTSSSTATTVASQTTTSTSSATLPSTVAAAVTACKKGISSSTTLPASEKSKLLAICQDFASGNVASAKAAYIKACQAEVKAQVPASERSIALATCQEFASTLGSKPTSTAPTSTGLGGVTSTLLLAACKEYEGPAGAVLPSSVRGELESACQQIKAGNVSAALPALKAACESYAGLAPSSERASVAQGCKSL
jgi:hypothetical protein